MNKYFSFTIMLLIAACSSKNTAQTDKVDPTATASTSGSIAAQPAVKQEKPEKEKDEIKWLTYDEAVKLSKKKPKKIFIDVYTDWCGWCKKMDKTTLKDPKIATYMNKKYYAVKLNAESDKTVTFQGKEMTERDLSAKVFKITGYPCTVYLESDEKIIQPVPGYMEVEMMDKVLHFIGDDHYKTTPWEQFQMSYTGD